MSDSSRPDGQKGWGLKNRSRNQLASTDSVDRTKLPSSADDLGETRPAGAVGGSEHGASDERREQKHGQPTDNGNGIGSSSSKQNGGNQQQQQQQQHNETKQPPQKSKAPYMDASVSAYDAYNREPAYISPIPKIPPIPPVASSGSGHRSGKDRNGVPSANRPQIPRWVTERMIGKSIDEFGDVVDDDGTVLGRVAGDLPSMVGRTVLNQRGDVLSDDGELLGYVAEVAPSKGKEADDEDDDNDDDDDDDDEDSACDDKDEGDVPSSSPPKSIDQYTGKSSASLQVDHRGNILDSYGNIIGHFRDHLREPLTEEEQKAEERRQREELARAQKGPSASSSKAQAKGKPTDDRPPNAAAWKKENESPSDIFLDVKSTTEGIQLTIRIPTVFANGTTPRVNFS